MSRAVIAKTDFSAYHCATVEVDVALICNIWRALHCRAIVDASVGYNYKTLILAPNVSMALVENKGPHIFW